MPLVLTETATMQFVADTGCSLARMGKCEFKLALDRNGIAQRTDDVLRKRLRKMLKSEQTHTLICLPRIFESMPADKARHYAQFTTPAMIRELFAENKLYGSTFVSRRDGWAADMDEPAYWRTVRGIWHDRPVLLVAGSGKAHRAADDLLDNAASVTVRDAPSRDAWADYETILADCWAWVKTRERPLVVAALGATATVLCHDLGKHGVQALDIGHMSQSYTRMDPKATEAA